MMQRKKKILLLGISVSFLILLTAVALKKSSELSRPRDSNHNIFFILIDTLRSDHMGCYGYHRNTTPYIDNIAEQGLLFTNFYSVSNWTNPTIASLFTGLYPQGVFPQAWHKDAVKLVLPPELDTLAEVVQRAGYKTAALVEHPGINPAHGFDQGFDEYVMFHKKYKKWPLFEVRIEKNLVRADVSDVIDRVKDQSFFIYLHVVYPHQPYTPPEPYNTMFGKGFEQVRPEERQAVINMYDGEIRYTDELVGGIFEDLKSRGLLKTTYMIITSDHGEGFWEHGFYEHGNSFFNEEIKIPLIIYPPGGRNNGPQIISTFSSNIDLFPTIVAFAGATNPDNIEGESLTRFFGPRFFFGDNDMLFSESPHSYDIGATAVISRSKKYIHTPNKPKRRHLLFDLEIDPDESNNQALAQKDLVRKLGRALRQHQSFNDEKRKTLSAQIRQLDKETIDGLKSLGYLK